ncbi:hypothetical protein [Akkermansia glycaniphila]|nr:hypothetical protein [Akkermansia glycaniphila]
MLIAVVLGYLVATMFLIAGVSRAVQVCMDLRPGIDFSEMMNLLLEPAFMVGVSVVMLLLIQIATFLERLMYSQLREEKRRTMESRKGEEQAAVPAVQAVAPAPVQESPVVSPTAAAAPVEEAKAGDSQVS